MPQRSSLERNRREALADTDPGALLTPSDLPETARLQITDGINRLIADAFVLYAKTKNFHWHVSGPNFRDFHRLLDEQGSQIIDTIDPLAERVRKLGQPTVKSLSQVLDLSSLHENAKPFTSPREMLNELMEDNIACLKAMREMHEICDEHKDIASAGLLEQFADAAEQRIWFLFESGLSADSSGH